MKSAKDIAQWVIDNRYSTKDNKVSDVEMYYEIVTNIEALLNNIPERNNANIDFRLADDSGYAALNTGSIVGNGNITNFSLVSAQSGGTIAFGTRTMLTSPANGNLLLQNAAGTDYGLLQFGGTTSSFPALKRNAANLLVRLADDSAYTNITALFTPPAGTTTTAPITLTSGTNKTTASEGSIEFSSNILYFTPSGTDRRMVQLLGRNAQSGTSYTVAASDMGKVVAMTGTAGATVTLPLANSVPAGSIVTIKDEGGAALSNNIVVQTSGSDKIDGQSNQSIVRNYGTLIVYNNGNTDWFIIASL